MQKLDPYLNVDPGTMNPFQHGEVFVTNDGAETDLDVGHYERFLDVDLARLGERDHRPGLFDGDRQGAPRRVPRRHGAGDPAHHQRDQGAHPRMAGPEVDVVITEVGGTVGDIESLPFLEAIRQIRHEIGRDNVFFLHVSLLPYIGPSGELKTKPTQHSVAALRNIGIQPDAIVLRADREVPTSIKRKISLMCDVDVEAVVAAVDAPSIYDIPEVLHPRASTPTWYAGSTCRSATSTGPRGTSCCAACTTPSTRSPWPWSASTSTCPTPTSRSPRRCAPVASRTTAASTSAGSPPTTA